MLGMNCNGVTWLVDPDTQYKTWCEDRGLPYPDGLGHLLGMIPEFFTLDDLLETPEALTELVEGRYGFPMRELGGEVGQDDVYRYPEDPALYPVAVTKSAVVKVIVYPYGITAINGKVYRLD
ncbi:hypothetical protein BCU74_03920 [Vibrio breoganii]|uniref:hypothetical protein n=1 Tax=Vibrio breoganii TaxID=553239 RepID=UPI000C822032|nr:hypothetical protein [Vibrio breoganii]PMH22244.1 hypothetical protein BCU74_03920 [Vibrio breoganii]